MPLIGDDTAAYERAADPAGWALPEADRAGLYRTVEARRDVRRYRPDPVPDEVLTRVLTAAHQAPSMGHSQPWRFVVVRDAGIRDTAAVLTDREPLRQAAQLDPDAAARLLTPPGSLGVLDGAVARAVALGRGDLTGGVLLLAAADHPVTTHRVSAYPASTTRDAATAAVAGVALGATAARSAGLGLVVVDAGVTGPAVPGAVTARPAGARGDLVTGPAMTAEDTAALLAAGRALGAEHGRSGLAAVGEVGVGNTTVAAALAAALLHVEPAEVAGLGSGADAAMVERKRDVVAAALARAGTELDPQTALAELGGPELAVLAGVVLGAAEAGAVVVLDGFATAVAALVAVLLEPAAQSALVAGQRSRERGCDAVLQARGCEPLLDLRLRAGEGVGAVLAAGLLLQRLRLRRETARVDSSSAGRPVRRRPGWR